MSINDGGPAFPADVGRADYIQTGPDTFRFPGMTLRDYFAGQALSGSIAADTANCVGNKVHAEYSYAIADEMIRVRDLLTDPLIQAMADALRACLAYIPGSEVHNWPPGFDLREQAIRKAQAALSKVEATA